MSCIIPLDLRTWTELVQCTPDKVDLVMMARVAAVCTNYERRKRCLGGEVCQSQSVTGRRLAPLSEIFRCTDELQGINALQVASVPSMQQRAWQTLMTTRSLNHLRQSDQVALGEIHRSALAVLVAWQVLRDRRLYISQAMMQAAEEEAKRIGFVRR